MLDVTGVGDRATKADVKFHEKVRADGNVVDLRCVGDLQPRSYPTNARYVDLDDAGSLPPEVLSELAERVQRLAHRDRY